MTYAVGTTDSVPNSQADVDTGAGEDLLQPLIPSKDSCVCYDNAFDHALDRQPVATGTDQADQLATAGKLMALHALSPEAGQEAAAREALRTLRPTPPLDGQPTATAEYTSRVPGVAPQQAYSHFVSHPGQVFGAAGIRVHGADGPLRDGQRLMLEEPARFPRPSMWAPIEVRLDPAQRSIQLTTLDGHPLRGRNAFHFLPDGAGGTQLRQESSFQGSSWVSTALGKSLGALDRQQDIWRAIHGEIAAALARCE